MLCPLKELRGYQIEATDGVIGRVVGVYFDDEQWRIRYIVVKTGGWLDARDVLLSPLVISETYGRTRTLATQLTKEQVEHGPSTDLDKLVSRQQETQISDYWERRGLWESRVPALMPMQTNGDDRIPSNDVDPHLRSSREIIGFHLHAIDDTLGHVEDLIIDNENWTIRYMAVDTSNWWFGGHVLISPSWIGTVRWHERLVDLRVPRDVIKRSPKWTPSYPITPEYEDSLLNYYRLCQAWSVDARSNEAPIEPSHKTTG